MASASGKDARPAPRPRNCPMEKAMAVIGGKWKLLIIWHLMRGDVLRYGELKRRIGGITDMMLSQSLKELEEHDIVNRKQYNEIPPKVEYSLTRNGNNLLTPLTQLSDWGKKQRRRHPEQ